MNQNNLADQKCDDNIYKRVRYFHGMLLGDRDFTEEQIYHNSKRKLLNRMLHGWGVVCGLGITWQENGKKFTIAPGMGLDCHGNEIVVNTPFDVNLTDLCLPWQQSSTTGNICEQTVIPAEPVEYMIGIGYAESPAAPVPVYAPGGGCEEKVCEYSRYQEGFCIKVASEFEQPALKKTVSASLFNRFFENCKSVVEDDTREQKDLEDECFITQVDNFMTEFCQTPPPCPEECPEDHFLILGKITIDIEKKTITDLSINGDRTYVWTNNLFKHLFVSLFDDLDSFFQLEKDGVSEELPDINLIQHNPVAALCWFGQVFRNRWEIKAKSENVEKIVNQFKLQTDSEIATLKAEISTLKAAISKKQSSNK